jgi:hypothetical protein
MRHQMSHGGRSEEPEEIAGLRAEIDQVERRVLRQFDSGTGAMVIALAVLVLLLAAVLPWVGGTSGWQVLLGQAAPGARVGLLPRIFAVVAFGVGVLASALALVTRRWWLAWVCALGGWLSVVTGVLAIWTQQTTRSHTPGPGPGSGLVLAVLAALVLAIQWFRIAWSRP